MSSHEARLSVQGIDDVADFGVAEGFLEACHNDPSLAEEKQDIYLAAQLTLMGQ